MRTLLIAFLLAVFSIQGVVVVVGEDVTAAGKAQSWQAAAATTLSEHIADDADGLKVSSAIEELSDYLPAVLSIPEAIYPVPALRLAHVDFLSTDLPTIKPPPRG